jgi:hypothetical protein
LSHQGRQLIVREQRVGWNTVPVRERLAQTPEFGEHCEFRFEEYFAIIDPTARLGRLSRSTIEVRHAHAPCAARPIGDDVPLDSQDPMSCEERVKFVRGVVSIQHRNSEEA